MTAPRALALVGALAFTYACGAEDSAAESRADATRDSGPSDATPDEGWVPDAALEAQATDASDASTEVDADGAASVPACVKSPCAARPIVFVHGFQGSWDDWVPMLVDLTLNDGRWDSFVLSGNDDALGWKPGMFGRRQWLFAFDYYLKKAADGEGSYSAGPGRIGSNRSYTCAAPSGQGHIIGNATAYDDGVTHEYAEDLALFVERVRTATGAPRVDIVAHSMGGMIVRSYLAYFGGSAVTERALLLASPIRGVGLIGFLQLFPVSGPSWQALHEVAELDSGTLVSKVRFLRCGEAQGKEGAFGQKLLDEEQASPPPTELYVMSGGSDITVSHDTADHPLEKWHEVVPGTSHSGMLTSDTTRERVSQTLGGKY